MQTLSLHQTYTPVSLKQPHTYLIIMTNNALEVLIILEMI